MQADLLAELDTAPAAFAPPAEAPAQPAFDTDLFIPPPVARPKAVTEGTLSPSDARRAKRLIAELWLRKNEALRIYEPLPLVENLFHSVKADIRLLRGSNRAGKTLSACVECARAVTAQDPHQKFPRLNGLAIAVGLDELHCGKVMFQNLCKPGAFKIIKDPHTGLYRAFRPWQAWDKANAHLVKPSPPLIPKRYIRNIAWNDKAKGIPKTITFTTGWELHFFSSKAMPPQGWKIDFWWIDEECENELWVPELQARVLDKFGVGWWSATPQVANPQLYDLHVRASEDDPRVKETVVLLSDNPHIDEGQKKKLDQDCPNDDERRVRILGEFRITGFLIYPEWSKGLHTFDAAGWQCPLNYSRYLITDPGRQICAVLFVAVPPPGEGDGLYFYDELYIKNCDADLFGRLVAEKSKGIVYDGWVIDSHAGRVTEMGSGKNVEQQYKEALKRHKVEARVQSFHWGSDDVKAGILAFRELLRVRDDGACRLKVPAGRLKHFEHEVERYHYKRVQKLVTDEPEKKGDHLMDCARYAASFNPRWRKPLPPKPPESAAVKALRKKRSKKGNQSLSGPSVRLGAGRL